MLQQNKKMQSILFTLHYIFSNIGVDCLAVFSFLVDVGVYLGGRDVGVPQ